MDSRCGTVCRLQEVVDSLSVNKPLKGENSDQLTDSAGIEMSNHVSRFFDAVSVLSGHGHIKQRLREAYEENLAVIEDDELPIASRQMFADLRQIMSRVDSLNGEGSVCASVRKMSIEEAEQCAHMMVDLFRDMQIGEQPAVSHTANRSRRSSDSLRANV